MHVGIGHPGQPTRLHARCHSRARSMLLEFPAHPAPGPDADSISDVALTKQKAHHKGELFVLLVETAGIEPASASPLQAVLHT